MGRLLRHPQGGRPRRARALGRRHLDRRGEVTRNAAFHRGKVHAGEQMMAVEIAVAGRAIDRNMAGMIEFGRGVIGPGRAFALDGRQGCMTLQARAAGRLIIHGGRVALDACGVAGGDHLARVAIEVTRGAVVHILGVIGVREDQDIIAAAVPTDAKRRAAFHRRGGGDRQRNERQARPTSISIGR